MVKLWRRTTNHVIGEEAYDIKIIKVYVHNIIQIHYII